MKIRGAFEVAVTFSHSTTTMPLNLLASAGRRTRMRKFVLGGRVRATVHRPSMRASDRFE